MNQKILRGFGRFLVINRATPKGVQEPLRKLRYCNGISPAGLFGFTLIKTGKPAPL